MTVAGASGCRVQTTLSVYLLLALLTYHVSHAATFPSPFTFAFFPSCVPASRIYVSRISTKSHRAGSTGPTTTLLWHRPLSEHRKPPMNLAPSPGIST
ncbi:hypothetical protein F5Y11DRAFT_314439 [Daldinia sp. FL1419]|nr:hypothetical protein F5Y11DRAFT_314439 [Daldinia sp. FL1419]